MVAYWSAKHTLWGVAMKAEKSKDQIVGYVLQMGFKEDDIPPADIVAICGGVVSVFSEEVLLLRCPYFLHFDAAIGAFHKFFPAKLGRPDGATLHFDEPVKISRPVTCYACIFEVTEIDD